MLVLFPKSWMKVVLHLPRQCCVTSREGSLGEGRRNLSLWPCVSSPPPLRYHCCFDFLLFVTPLASTLRAQQLEALGGI